MKIHKINCGTLKLDAGAMFGVVPKAMWSKVYEADENNLAFLNMRSLLIEDEGRLILIDTGAGDKFNEKLKGIYQLSENYLYEEIQKIGFDLTNITDVLLTHLHFDHCGGATKFDNGEVKPAFPKASYYVSKSQWDSAINPVLLERASFFPENFLPIDENKQLKLFDNSFNLTRNIKIRLFNGHTKGLSVPIISYKGKTIVFISDLIPLMSQIKASWICAYDNEPIVSLNEKIAFLEEIYNEGGIVFSEHDYYNECCNLKKTEKGIEVDRFFSLEEVL